MRVALLYNAPALTAGAEEQDVLEQVNAVQAALAELRHEVLPIGCTLDLAALDTRLEELAPDAVFNLVEALGGTDRLAPLVPQFLTLRGLPYTGAPAAALLDCLDKVAVKRRARAAGIATPDWWAEPADALPVPGTFIIKARYEHASVGLDDAALVAVDCSSSLPDRVAARSDLVGLPCFAERFVPGREFNLALLDDIAGVQLLPPAEIDFSAFPPDKPRIVGFAAKWDTEAFEYHATPRRFPDAPVDRALGRCLQDQASALWALFGLRGYARADFRVDPAGQPWLLEINPNPCIAPDAGFAAALAHAGISMPAAIARLLATAGT